MPLLSIDTSADLSCDEETAITAGLTERYADEMDTDTSHIAVVIRTHASSAVSLGRSVSGPIVFLDADIRRGRPFEQRRRFALSVIDWFSEQLSVPRTNTKVVFTEHEGEQMMGADRVGGTWSPNEG